MSRHQLAPPPGVIGNIPTNEGFWGSRRSKNATPSTRPRSAYSTPVTGSVQPQMSLKQSCEEGHGNPSISSRGTKASKSRSLQGYPAASPSTQGTRPVMRAVWETPSCASSTLTDAALPSPACCWKNRAEEASAVETKNRNMKTARAHPANRAERPERTFPHTAFAKIPVERNTGSAQEKSRDTFTVYRMRALYILRLRVSVSERGTTRAVGNFPHAHFILKFFGNILFLTHPESASEMPRIVTNFAHKALSNDHAVLLAIRHSANIPFTWRNRKQSNRRAS